jgi:glycosyltransferase involved in cell wall biosynthesis
MKESPANRSQVLVLGMDTFARKNIIKIRELEAEGYAYTIVANDQRGDSRAIFDAQGFEASRLIVVKGLGEKLRTAWRLLRAGGWHHVELYPAGRMAVAYLAFMKALRRPFIVIERGDVGCMSQYNFLVRLALKTAYRWAELVVFKETYMEAPLRRLTRAPLIFLPNCVAEAAPGAEPERDIDFLWVNRLIPERKIAWVIAGVGRLDGRRLLVLGAEDESSRPPGSDRVTILGFVDPAPYYRRARYFCLPASIVFANNSLLEAMSSGVVPIVTESPGVGLLVEDGVNGIVTAFDEAAYGAGMARAATLGEDEWRRLSAAAVATVREKYSVEAWTRQMADVYARLDPA